MVFFFCRYTSEKPLEFLKIEFIFYQNLKQLFLIEINIKKFQGKTPKIKFPLQNSEKIQKEIFSTMLIEISSWDSTVLFFKDIQRNILLFNSSRNLQGNRQKLTFCFYYSKEHCFPIKFPFGDLGILISPKEFLQFILHSKITSRNPFKFEV